MGIQTVGSKNDNWEIRKQTKEVKTTVDCCTNFSAAAIILECSSIPKRGDICIDDSEATYHSTFCAQGGRNGESVTVASRGTASDVCDLKNCAIPSMVGNSRDHCRLVRCNYREACSYGLFSLTRVLRDGWSICRNAEATKMKKKGRKFVFSFKSNTTRVAAVAVAVVAVVDCSAHGCNVRT